MSKVIIAVDVGTHSTVAVAYKLNREVLKEVVSNTKLKIKKDKLINDIAFVIEELLEIIDDRNQLMCIYIGIIEWEQIKQKDELKTELTQRYNTKIRIESEALISLYTVLKDKTDCGILVNSEYDQVAYGIKSDHILKLGGYGPYIDDKGTAYNIVLSAIQKIANDVNHGRQITDTSKEFMQKLNISHVNEFNDYIKDEDTIMKLLKVLAKLAIDGHKEVRTYFVQAGKDMAQRALLIHKRLNFDDDITIGLSGRVLIKSPYVQDAFIDTIKPKLPSANFDVSNTPRVMGAYYMALQDFRLGKLK